ncbi:MAG: hypothetical protein HWE09_13355 [Cyclobacteriaceae bacterium]|uniref:DUF6090 family protein n=1 Tax=Algoriphagus sp. TaxID=1872435 RepID=UPI00179D7177|nr:DUF6090 family protein [Algoriphagus sp.]NVJ85734.1 hypothetical protein [Algoriphagus sp.]NVK50750.1 hypothetical protein [Cyclobacteriaceae bacterium]
MIKFFRKIRQNILREGKIGKYLTYAIGEIILVVIGILIALQINNNNQDKLNRTYELTMLNEIKNAIEIDIYNIEGGLKELEKLKYSVNKLATIRNNPNYPEDSLMYYFTKVRRGGIAVVFNYSPYESIKSTGLDRISNSELRNNITNLYEVKLTGVEFWINDLIKRQLYKKNDLVATLFDKEVIPDSINGIKVNYLINNKSMNDPRFNEFLVLSGDYIPIAYRNMTYAMSELKTQLKEIESELNK